MSQYAVSSKNDIQDFSDSNISLAVLPLAGRILLSAIYLISGLSKLATSSMTISYIASAGIPFAPLAYAGTVIVEILFGVALLVGYRTRLAAAILAAFTIAAAVIFHSNLADQNQFFHFFKNMAMAGGLLQIVAFGAGRISLDAYRA